MGKKQRDTAGEFKVNDRRCFHSKKQNMLSVQQIYKGGKGD